MFLQLCLGLIPLVLSGITGSVAYGKLQEKVKRANDQAVLAFRYAQAVSKAQQAQGLEMARMDERLKSDHNDLVVHTEADLRAFTELKGALSAMNEKLDRLISNMVER